MIIYRLKLTIYAIFALILLLPGTSHAADQEADPLIIFAASSLGPPLDEIAHRYEAETGRKVRVAYGSSAVLARQVANGAPADLYIGAHMDWIDYLVDQGLALLRDTRPIAVNTLVVAGTARLPAQQQGQEDLRTLLLHDPAARIAVGNTNSVPLGIYTKEALKNLGLWEELHPRLAPAANARRTLAFVTSGSLDLGILFASDAASDDRVYVLAHIPVHLYDPIRYIAVPLSPGAADFVNFATGERGREILIRHDFMPFESARKD